jgi:hypothetical protein
MEIPGTSISSSPRAHFHGSAFGGSTLAPHGKNTAAEDQLSSPNVIVACAVFAIFVLLGPALYLIWKKRRQTTRTRDSQQESGAGLGNQANGETQQDQEDSSSTNVAEEANTARLIKQYIVTNSFVSLSGTKFAFKG